MGVAAYSAATTSTISSVKASPGTVYSMTLHNTQNAISYVQIFDSLSTSVTVGTTPPTYSIGIPANGTVSWTCTRGIPHGTGISVASTTTRTGSSSATVNVNLEYK